MDCKLYFCFRDFCTAHKHIKQEEEHTKAEDLKEDTKQDETKYKHKFRAVAGCDESKLDTLPVGWNTHHDICQIDRLKKREEEAERRKARQEEERRRKEREDEEERERLKRIDEDMEREEQERAKKRRLEAEKEQESATKKVKVEEDCDSSSSTVHVANISFDKNMTDVRSYFRQFGRISNITFPRHTKTAASTSSGTPAHRCGCNK